MDTTFPYRGMDGIIAKILSKEATVEEVMVFSGWINESPENRKEMEMLSEYWDGGMEEDPLRAELSFQRNESRLFGDERPEAASRKRSGNSWKLLLSIAAACALLLALGHAWFWSGKRPETLYVLLSQDGVERFTLPDQTLVVLNHDSRITYSDRFSADSRTVVLEGEAYFEVAKAGGKKFTVQVGDSEIEVLGTRFNVDARHTDECIVTTLLEGSVLFRHARQEQLLHPDQQLTYYPRSGVMEKCGTDACLSAEWKDGIVRYSGIRMQELVHRLEERYGVKVILSGRYQDIKVSGAFQQQQSLEKVLKVMQESIGFKWKMKDGEILIY